MTTALNTVHDYVGNAKLQGLTTQLHLSSVEYNLALVRTFNANRQQSDPNLAPQTMFFIVSRRHDRL